MLRLEVAEGGSRHAGPHTARAVGAASGDVVSEVHVYLPSRARTADAAPRRGQAKDPELSRRPNNGGSTGGLPLARRDQTVEPGSAGFEDQEVGSRLIPGDTFTVTDDCNQDGFSLRRSGSWGWRRDG